MCLAQRFELHPTGEHRQSTERSLCIDLRIPGPLFRHFVCSEDCFDRTFRDTSIAVNAGLWIDHQHIVIEMKSVHRANHTAICVTTVYAGLRDDIRHKKYLPPSYLKPRLF